MTTYTIYGENEKEKTPRNIILIGWDGAQRNHVKECLSRNELPNLKQLSSEGTIVAIDILRTTDTKAGWTQILTGYEPEITGVFDNGRYQPIPKGYTVFERLEKFFGPENIITVAVIGKKGHVDDDAPKKIRIEEKEKEQKATTRKNIKKEKKGKTENISKEKARKKSEVMKKQQVNIKKKQEGQIITENGVKYLVIPGKPYYNTKDGMDLFINGLKENEVVGKKAIELMEKYKDKPFFFFVHFAEVDHKGHGFGENSKEYNDALISSDFWTGKIIEKLKELNLYDKTLIYVTADHGFDEGMKGHKDAPYVFLATNDKTVIRRGLRADITPTILDRFGVDLTKIEPPLDGHPLTKPYSPSQW
jgi:hypothetical protein